MSLKIITIFASIVFCASLSLAQDQTQQQLNTQGWVQQSSGTTNGIRSVKFTSRDTGWAACADAGILRTTDAGQHWNQFLVPDPLGVTCIDAVDGMTAWCSNSLSHGNMFFTNDGGQNWTQQIPNSGAAIEALSFPTKNTGFGAGGTAAFLIKTTNGGQAWTRFPLGNGLIRAVNFLDSLNGLVAGDGALFRIVNGGPGYLLDTTFPHANFFGCCLSTQRREFGVGGEGSNSIIVRSTNSGKTWDRPQIPSEFQHILLTAITFTDSIHGTIVGYNGAILHTDDGGDSWLKQVSGVTNNLNAISFSDSVTGTIVGDFGIILRTTDGGYSWVQQYFPTPLEVKVSPEPFATNTTLSYSIPKAAKVEVKVYDVMGKEVYHTESEGIQSEGVHTIELSGAGLPAGVYYFLLNAGGFSGTGKMTKIVP